MVAVVVFVMVDDDVVIEGNNRGCWDDDWLSEEKGEKVEMAVSDQQEGEWRWVVGRILALAVVRRRVCPAGINSGLSPGQAGWRCAI